MAGETEGLLNASRRVQKLEAELKRAKTLAEREAIKPRRGRGAGGRMTEKSDELDEPLTIKFSRVGEWWTATVQTPNGMLVGSGPTREAAQEELDWLMLHRSEKSIPPG